MNIIFALILLTLAILALIRPNWKKRRASKRWFKAFDLHHHTRVFMQLFRDVDGFALSKQARKNSDAFEYTYGEIDFISFIALLSCLPLSTETIFYDLGSGVGKAVLACAMVFKVRKSCGIELFEELHLTALKQKESLQQNINYQQHCQSLCFLHENFLVADFSDATVIFINATAFFGDTWVTLQKRLVGLNSGVIVITTSKKIDSDAFHVTHIKNVQMSWGVVRAYVQKRL